MRRVRQKGAGKTFLKALERAREVDRKEKAMREAFAKLTNPESEPCEFSGRVEVVDEGESGNG